MCSAGPEAISRLVGAARDSDVGELGRPGTQHRARPGPTTARHGLDTYRAAAQAAASALDTADPDIQQLLPSPTEHYLSGTYPPLKAMEPADADDVFRDASARLSLYVHIPFCRQRCTFCHFAKEVRATPGRVSSYFEALTAEIKMVAGRLGPREVSSVYIGGGTPSVLSPAEVTRLFTVLSEVFPWDSGAEVTFELHPQVVRNRLTLSDQLKSLRAAGVNRIAFGVQSLDDRVLRTLNRGHTAGEALALADVLTGSDFGNVSADLMYGLPHETLDGWYDTLRSVVEHGISKLNIFPLFLKVTDPISRLYDRKPHVFPDRRDRLITHLVAEEYLRDQGFRRGPVFYYSRAGRHSVQQELKFDSIDDTNLLGLGASSFGYLGGTQYYNRCDVDEYMAEVGAGRLPLWRAATLSRDELARRTVMFALRSAGVRRATFRARFGALPEDMFPQMARFRRLGLLSRVNDTWITTDLGAYCVDGMAAQFASDDVQRRIAATDEAIADRRTSLLEQHHYSPLGHTGIAGAAQSAPR